MQPINRRMSPRPRKQIDTSTYSGRFAVRLRELRDKAGMTVPELAKKTGIPESTLQAWELENRQPTIIERLPELAEALKTTPRNLLPKE